MFTYDIVYTGPSGHKTIIFGLIRLTLSNHHGQKLACFIATIVDIKHNRM